jgi:hypothetical protein
MGASTNRRWWHDSASRQHNRLDTALRHDADRAMGSNQAMRHNRAYELFALTGLAAMAMAGIPATLLVAKELEAGDGQVIGIAIGGFVTVLPIIINAIRNIGQGQAMQSLVDHLAQSQPKDGE